MFHLVKRGGLCPKTSLTRHFCLYLSACTKPGRELDGIFVELQGTFVLR